MEIAALMRAFEDMKEVSDPALKLAEASKKSSLGNWELAESLAWPLCLGSAIRRYRI